MKTTASNLLRVSGLAAVIGGLVFAVRIHPPDTLAAVSTNEWVIVHAVGQPEPLRRSFPPVDTLRLELEAFADAIEGRAPYPIGDADMVATVAAFEAVCRSVKSGRTETVSRA